MERGAFVSYKDIHFEKASHQFDYRIGHGALDSLVEKLSELGDFKKVTILCDKVDEPRTAKEVTDLLEAAGITCVLHAVRFGDEVRTFEEAGRVLERLIEKEGMDPDLFIACGPLSILKLGSYISYLLDANLPLVFIPTNPLSALLAPITGASVNLGKLKDALTKEPQVLYMCYDFESEKHLGLKTLRDVYPYLARFCFANSAYAFNSLCLDAEKLKQKDALSYLTHMSNALYQLSKLVKETGSQEELMKTPELCFADYTQKALERSVNKNTFYPGEYMADAMRLDLALAQHKLGLESAYKEMLNDFFSTLSIKALDIDLAVETYFVSMLGESQEFLNLNEEEQEKRGLAEEISLLLPHKPGEFEEVVLDQADLISVLEDFAAERRELVPVHRRRDYKK